MSSINIKLPSFSIGQLVAILFVLFFSGIISANDNPGDLVRKTAKCSFKFVS